MTATTSVPINKQLLANSYHLVLRPCGTLSLP